MCSSALTVVPSMPMKAPKDSIRRTVPWTSDPTLRFWQILQGSTWLRSCAQATSGQALRGGPRLRLLHSLQRSTHVPVLEQ